MSIFEKLKINEKNPRKISKEKFEKLKKSLKSFPEMLEKRPIVYDEDFVILGGNMRLKALKELVKEGMVLKDTYFLSAAGWTKAKKREFVIRDNVELGEWDDGILQSDWGDLPLDEWGVDANWKVDAIVEDVAPEVNEEEVFSKLGEVYQMGRHRIMCGDSAKIEDVQKLMGDKKADLIFTDPPYGVDYKSPSGNSYNSGKYAHMGTIFNDDKDSKENLEFFRDVLANLYVVSKDMCVIYWWLAFNSNAMENLIAFKQTGWKMSQQITWVKDRFVFSRGQDYHRMSEPCFFGWKEGKTHFTNKKINNLADVFNLEYKDLKLIEDIWFENRDKTTEYLHPTQKPVKLAYRAINKSSEHGFIVLDLFAGSGSTVSACEQAGRVCYTMELDPHYVDVVRKRYANLVGKGDQWEQLTNKL